MNKTTSTALAFVIGAVAGAAGAWYALKDRYERLVEEEVDSVREAFFRARRNETEKRDTPIEYISDDRSYEHDETEKRDTPIDYYSISAPKDEEKEDEPKDGPYVITPREYGSIDDYEQIILVFWKDHVLTDDNFDIVEDIEDCVGFESLNHFGEYMDDVVYVRNDRTKCDYEISLDLRTYDEVVRERPYIRGVL